MSLTDELIAFIRDHRNDNLDRLLLSASKYPGIDMGFVVDQIIAREKIREKLPSWGAIERLYFPSRLAAEQCSSERTAAYTHRLVQAPGAVCELTGGVGVVGSWLRGAVARYA